MRSASRQLITFPPDETQGFGDLERMLSEGPTALVSASGERWALTPAVRDAFKRVVAMMAKGQSITLLPEDEVVTTQLAADLLGVSRPFFVKLLDTGLMAHHRVGNQRRVYLRDVQEFARRRDAEREAALNRLSRHAVETGLYDRNVMPEGGSDD